MQQLRLTFESFASRRVGLDALHQAVLSAVQGTSGSYADVCEYLGDQLEQGRLSRSDHAALLISLREAGFDSASGHTPEATRIQQRAAAHPAAPNSTYPDTPASTAASGQPDAGALLSGRYYLERRLGEGGMGIVFLARDLEGDRQGAPSYLAVKVLKPDFRQHPDSLRALFEEVRKSRMLAHPNVVGVYSYERSADLPFITMEYLDGRTLDGIIEEDYPRGMPLLQALPLIHGMGKALAYAHDNGIVHSDFKPSNVLMTAAGKVKVLDFGIARAFRAHWRAGYDTSALGAMTPPYAATEVENGEAPDVRDDVYAFACVVYELLSGRHPYRRLSASGAERERLSPEHLPNLSGAQNQALRKALDTRRDKRTGTVEELLDSFESGSGKRLGSVGAVAAAVTVLVIIGAWILAANLYDDEPGGTETEAAVTPEAGGAAPDPLADPAASSENRPAAAAPPTADLERAPPLPPSAAPQDELCADLDTHWDTMTCPERRACFARRATVAGFALEVAPPELAPALRRRAEVNDRLASAACGTLRDLQYQLYEDFRAEFPDLDPY